MASGLCPASRPGCENAGAGAGLGRPPTAPPLGPRPHPGAARMSLSTSHMTRVLFCPSVPVLTLSKPTRGVRVPRAARPVWPGRSRLLPQGREPPHSELARRSCPARTRRGTPARSPAFQSDKVTVAWWPLRRGRSQGVGPEQRGLRLLRVTAGRTDTSPGSPGGWPGRLSEALWSGSFSLLSPDPAAKEPAQE